MFKILGISLFLFSTTFVWAQSFPENNALAIPSPTWVTTPRLSSTNTPTVASTSIPSKKEPQPMTDCLPKPGSITWNVMGALDLDNSDYSSDASLSNFGTSGDKTENSTIVSGFAPIPLGFDFGVGADLALSSRVQIGFDFEGIYKSSQPVTTTTTETTNVGYGPVTSQYATTDMTSDFCLGLAFDGKYLLPVDRQLTFIIVGEFGYYTLTGASDTEAYVGSSPFQTNDFNTSTFGEYLGVQLECMIGAGVGLDFGLGYRHLLFSPLTYTGFIDGGYGVTNYPGSSMDFSGFRFSTELRLF